MKLILTSDLHYGCAPTSANTLRKFFKRMAAEIEKQDVRAVILAGDLASTRQRQFLRCIELASEFVKVPILLVKGNHDLWDGSDPKDKNAGTRTLDQIYRLQKSWMDRLGIHHLEEGPYELEDVIICGFDGWYGSSNPPTNDTNWMPRDYEGCPIMPYLSNRAWKKFEKCLDLDTSDYRKSVIITHHNPYRFGKGYAPTSDSESVAMSANLKFLDEMRGKFDVLCCGHTHSFKNEIDKKGPKPIRILNCGSDYNQPKYLLFEV